MRIRCPHCHNPIEVVDESALGEINCPSCGSSFSLTRGETTTTFRSDGLRRLAQFELVRELGVGKSGSVWLARDTQLDRTVAVKIPRKDALDTQESELFLRDARAAAQLKHPHIVGVHEVGREKDTLYIVSDYIEGVNLREWLSAQRMSFRESAELVVKVAEALEHAHQAGVVHRDLKPGNIMLDGDGQPHVIDFGLAKRDAGEITMTVDGHILGTPAYMSPEQAKGKGHEADRRSDVYSLGVILFELLTGELPFRGETQMLLYQIQRDEPPRPRRLNARIPRDLETITLKCLEKEPARRYQTALALADDLNHWLAGRPIVARPIGRAARGWRWCKRQPVVAGLATAVASALIAGTAISAYFAIRATTERDRADSSAQVAIEEKVRADANAEQARREKDAARRLLYRADMNLAERAWEDNHIEQVSEIMGRHDADHDLQGFEFFYQRRLLHSNLRTFNRNIATDPLSWQESFSELVAFRGAVAFSPDGRRLASASWGHTIKLWDADTGAELRTLRGHSSWVKSVAFSPDGRRIASASDDNTIMLWDAETGDEFRMLGGHESRVMGVAFSPDGRRLASASSDRTIKLWDTETGDELRTLRGHSSWVTSVAFSPDGRRLASASSDRTIKLWDADSGDELRTLRGHSSRVMSVAFSLDGRRIASACYDNSIKVWDAETGAELRTLKGHTQSVECVAFSPNGRRLASASSDKTVKVWDAETGAELRTLKDHTSRVTSVAFSPDGNRIVSASEDCTFMLWDAQTDPELRTLQGHTDFVNSVVFSPDGQRLASASSDKTVKVWDAETGAELRTLLKGHTSRVRSVAFSPDGRRLASASDDKTIKLWDAETGTVLRALEDHTRGVSSVAFSPDGRRLASASADWTINLWNAETGDKLRMLQAHARPVECVTFSPDGGRLASASQDQTVVIWDVESGAKLRTLEGHTSFVHSVAFSPNGRRLASASWDKTIKLWDAETGAELRTLRGHSSRVMSVAFSLDGRRIASGSYDNSIKVWYAEAGAELRTLKGHTFGVTSVAFSPDGRRLASASFGRTINLWDTVLLTPDERMARFLVDGLYSELVFSSAVTAAIEHATNWNQAMRDAAVAYARARGDNSALLVARGKKAIDERDWPTALASFDLAFATRSPDVETLVSWSDALAMTGNWQGAAAKYACFVEINNRPWSALWVWALLQLAAGDEAGYRAACAELIEKHSETKSPRQAYWIALTCAIEEHAVNDMEKVVSLAWQAADADPRNPVPRSALGAALYRAGKTTEAIATLKKALPEHVLAGFAAPKQYEQIQVSRLAGEIALALAYHKQGDQAALEKQVAAVRKLAASLEKSPPKPSESIAPWGIAFTIERAKRELARIEVAMPPATDTKQ